MKKQQVNILQMQTEVVMHGARVIDNPNGLTEIELIKQDIESGADKNEIEQRYNNELESLDKNGVSREQEQTSNVISFGDVGNPNVGVEYFAYVWVVGFVFFVWIW